jgi:hypothetical protein
LINPKGFLWCGEDSISPQIKKTSGKNVMGMKLSILPRQLLQYYLLVLLSFALVVNNWCYQKYYNYKTMQNK